MVFSATWSWFLQIVQLSLSRSTAGITSFWISEPNSSVQSLAMSTPRIIKKKASKTNSNIQTGSWTPMGGKLGPIL